MDFEQALQELQKLYSTSNRVPGIRRKVMVDSDQFSLVINNLQTVLPADIQEAREILRQKDSIINQSHLEVQRVKADLEAEISAQRQATQAEHVSKVGSSEIIKAAEERAAIMLTEAANEAEDLVQEAQRRAYRIISESEEVAASRRDGADQYAQEVLFSVEERLSEVLGQIRRGIDTLRPDAVDSLPRDNGIELRV